MLPPKKRPLDQARDRLELVWLVLPSNSRGSPARAVGVEQPGVLR